MTKHENQVLFELSGKFDQFLQEWIGYKEEVKKNISDLSDKVDKGQAEEEA